MDLTASSPVNAGSASVLLRPFEPGTLILLSGADAGNTLGISAGDLANITAGTVTIGNASAGNLSLSANLNAGSQNINLLSGGDVIINNGFTLKTTGDASVTAGGNIPASPALPLKSTRTSSPCKPPGRQEDRHRLQSISHERRPIERHHCRRCRR